MSSADFPSNEQARIAALQSYHVLDTATEQDYEELTELAAAICGTPIALISLVEKDRQWFKSHKGLDVTETERSHSFCAQAIQHPTELMQVEDAHLDDRFKDNPLVTGNPQITFYAGMPLVDEDGYALGSLCVIDHKPKVLNETQQKALRTLAKQVINKLSLRRKLIELEASHLTNTALHEKSRRNETDLRNVIAQSPAAIIIFRGPDLVIEAANAPMLELLDQQPGIVGQALLQAIPELKGQPACDLLYTIYRTGEPVFGYDTPVQLKRNGQVETGYFNFTYTPLLENGQVVGIIDMAVEVTEQVKARLALEQSENHLKAANQNLLLSNEQLNAANQQLLENEKTVQELYNSLAANEGLLNQFVQQAPAGIAIYNGPRLVISTINQAAQELLPKRDFIGRSVFEALPEIVGTPAAESLIHCYSTGQPYQVSDALIPVAREEGGELEDRYFNLSYIPHRDPEGNISGLFSFTVETTEQVKARRNVADLNDRINTAVDAGGFGYTEVELATGKMQCNDTFKRCYGRTPDQDFSYPELFKAMLPQYREHIRARVAKAKAENSLYEAEYEVRWPDGSLHWIRANGSPRYNELGEADRMVGLVKDITNEKQSEQTIIKLYKEIGEKEESLRLSVEAAKMGTYNLNLNTGIVEVNQYCREIFGFADDQIVTAQDGFSMMAEDEQRINEAMNHSILHRSTFDEEYRIVRKTDNSIRWVRSVGRVYENAEGTRTNFSGTMVDITERKQEDQRKMDFIGIVSHELRSPLTSLNGYVQMLEIKAKRAEDHWAQGIMAKAKRQVDKMSSMITGFLDVARLGESQIRLNRTSFDMAALVKLAEEESLATITSHKVVFHPVEYTPVNADQDKIEQVLVNFINNAVKYSPAGSTINVACITRDGRAHVAVADEGMGIAPKDQPHVFNRFYRVDSESMKTVKGFGIGLYLCKDIIERHGGKIGVESVLYKGSTFWFDLPVAI